MIRPLTKCEPDGVAYLRPAGVEQQIGEALGHDLTELRQRLRVTDRKSPGYLKSECLVHLIRQTLRAGQQAKADVALTVLLMRCEAMLRVKIPDDALADAASVREEIISQFGELFAMEVGDPTLNELDFYECRFNLAFRALRVDCVRSEVARLNHLAPLTLFGDSDEIEADDDVFARVSEAFRSPATQESTLFLDDLWGAINRLPPDQREAVILVHVMGHKEESKFPNEVTAATICDVDGRTIRNRLKRAAVNLARFKEEK